MQNSWTEDGELMCPRCLQAVRIAKNQRWKHFIEGEEYPCMKCGEWYEFESLVR